MLRKQFKDSPIAVRVAPFLIFVSLPLIQGWFGESGKYWLYLLKTIIGAWLLWEVRPFVAEMRAKVSWEAVAVGVGVLVMWVGIDGWYPSLSEIGRAVLNPILSGVGFEHWCLRPPAIEAHWNPHTQFGDGSALAWFFIAVRILGSALVVPALEEVFFRSFLYRYIARLDFQSFPLGQFAAVPFFLTSAVFAFEHEQWLAGLLCGFAYQGLVLWKKRLGDAIAAHAITNCLLGLWVVGKGAWQFW
jgi:membrane protease YdiL (CAAX protease family)